MRREKASPKVDQPEVSEEPTGCPVSAADRHVRAVKEIQLLTVLRGGVQGPALPNTKPQLQGARRGLHGQPRANTFPSLRLTSWASPEGRILNDACVAPDHIGVKHSRSKIVNKSLEAQLALKQKRHLHHQKLSENRNSAASRNLIRLQLSQGTPVKT